MKDLNKSEQLLLEIICDLGPIYSNPIMKELDDRTGETSNGAQVYFALKNLEKKGYIRSWLGEPTKERGGRPKRYYDCIRTIQDDDENGLISSAEAVILDQLLHKAIDDAVKEEAPEVPANGIYIR